MACVATMPTSASAQSTPLPTENTRDWTAPPTSPVAGSYPRIENVPVSHTTGATVPCAVTETAKTTSAAAPARTTGVRPASRLIRCVMSRSILPAFRKESRVTRDELQAFAEGHMQAWGRRDPSALAANHSLDGVVESPMFATLRGRPAIEDAYRAYFTSFPDSEAA